MEGDFARDGYCVLRGALDAATVAALRRDADRRSAGLDLTQDSTVWVHDLQHLPLHAPARTDAAAYLELRAQGGESSPLLARALLHTLPAAAAAATGWTESGWRLFNEHFVIKPAHGGQHFLWHRDADRHLRCAEMAGPRVAAPNDAEGERVEGRFYAGPPPPAVVAYVNTYAPHGSAARTQTGGHAPSPCSAQVGAARRELRRERHPLCAAGTHATPPRRGRAGSATVQPGRVRT